MDNFERFLQPGRRGYLLGIGGVSMAPLAEVLAGMGLHISGTDISESAKVLELRERGIRVNIGHRAENISADTEFIIRTAAVHDDNPEIVAARQLGIPVFERTQAWGALMKDYKNALCIAGTHGKTTTTSMCTHILMAAEKDPTVMIGGTLPLLHAGHRIGNGDTIVMESCEYYDSFLSFYPTIAILLDIEEDHMDYFRDLDHIKQSFRRFAELVPADGTVIANHDDDNTMDAIAGLERKVLTYGFSSEADVYAKNIQMRGPVSEFDVYYQGRFFTHLNIQVPGRHNISNALAATAAAIVLNIRPTAVTYGLSAFRGANRRFEYKGKFNGADVYDDYAHHPGELEKLLDAVKPLGYKRILLVFQPHTYSRTQKFFDRFVEQLKRADVTYLLEIYAARETNTLHISSADLAKQIPNSFFFPEFEKLEQALRLTAAPGDIILTVGAGNVYEVGDAITAQETK